MNNAPNYRGQGFYGSDDYAYRYPETRGLKHKAVPKWIERNVLNLLPTKAETLKLLRSMGAVETGLSGWPQMRELEAVFLEGFFKVNDLWSDVDNLSGSNATEMIDLVAMGKSTTQRPEITYEYWKRAYYHYSMFGMRFAFNEWDRKVLGSNFNRYMNEVLSKRIDSYSMALNRLLWEHGIRSRTIPGSSALGAVYRDDADGMTANASIQDVGTIPYYLNSPSFRIGFAVSLGGGNNLNAANFPVAANTANGVTHICAITFHDGSIWNHRSASAPSNPNHVFPVTGGATAAQFGAGATTDANLHVVFSNLPYFWFPDAVGLPLFRYDGGSNGAPNNRFYLAAPASGDDHSVTIGSQTTNYRWRECHRKLYNQIVGALERGYSVTGAAQGASNTVPNNYRRFFHGATSNTTDPLDLSVVDFGLETNRHVAWVAPFLWELPGPFQFSPALGDYLQRYINVPTNNEKILTHNHWSRILSVIRNTRQPTVISARHRIGTTDLYPIYFGEYGIQTTGNPWAHIGFLNGQDTRFTLKPQVLERLHSYMRNNGATGQKVLACHPNIAIALNIYAMGRIEWTAQNRRTYGPVDFRAEFPRFGDFVIFTDLMIPEGIIYVIVPSERSLSFAFDTQDFNIEEVPTKNAIRLYKGFFIMRLMMSSAHQHGMIWGVKPDTLSEVI